MHYNLGGEDTPSIFLNSFVCLSKVKRCCSERCSLSCARYLHVYLQPSSLHAIVLILLDTVSLLCCCCMCLYSPERCWYCLAQNWQLNVLFFTAGWVVLTLLTAVVLVEEDAGWEGILCRRGCVTEVVVVLVSLGEANWAEGCICFNVKCCCLVSGGDERVPSTLSWSGYGDGFDAC